MVKKHSILLAQANYHYGENVFVPYSAGALQAYAQTFPEIREHFQFQTPLFLRENFGNVLKNRKELSIVGFSSYLWNWEYNKALAKILKQQMPKCLIVFGGTQVPNDSEYFFTQHPYVDLLVHYEGETAFVEILREFLSLNPDYTKIPGLSVNIENNAVFKTEKPTRIKDLSQLPSPYLSGVFDFLADKPFVLNVSQETNRGCPYTCTFCDWGGNTYDKIFSMDEDRIIEEFEWFGKRKAEYLFNCDANYGILSRDYGLTEKMIAIRAKHGGYPNKFRMCTAKNSNNKIFAIAKILNDAGMNKGATLSFQSMDSNTLNIVRRSNIKNDVFSELMNRYREADIPTYTELIMGMPGETYQSTKNGVSELFDGQEDIINIYVYLCSVLPNSEMSRQNYMEQHKIKTARMPILLAHSTPEQESLTEYQNVIVETASMSNNEWKRTYLFYWAVQAFHCLGLVQYIAIAFHKETGIKYGDFYEQLVDYFSEYNDTLVGEQINLVKNKIDESMNNGRLDLILPDFGNIYWPLEEASFLIFIFNKTKFYQEIRLFAETLSMRLTGKVNGEMLDDLVRYQSAIMKDPHNSETMIELRYDFPSYFSCIKIAESILSFNFKHTTKLCINVEHDFAGDLESYAREVVWYGRKGGKFHYSDISKTTTT